MKHWPASWVPVTGNQVFTFVTSGSRGWAQYYAQSGASFIRVGNLDHHTIALDLNDVQCVQPPVGAEGERTRLQAHDVLVSITAEVGMVGLVPPALGEAYINQHIALARPVRGLEPRFLAWYLASEADGKRSLLASSRGGTKSGLGLDDIRQVEMPLAPLAEQQRIADKLDAVVARVDACRDRLARVTPLLKRFRQSVLASATTGALTADWRTIGAPASVVQATLADICEAGRVITYGVVKLGADAPDGTPCLRTSNVRWLRIELQGMKHIDPLLAAEYGRTVLRGGEVLVNIRGTLGGVAVAAPAMAGWNVSREVAVVPIDATAARPDFVALWIGSDETQRWLTGVAKGVAYTGINIEDLRTLRIMLPSLAEQAEIVRRVDTLFAFADRLEARLAKAQAAADRLTPALLAKAFRGELVPQDPNDEPAAELLKRLAASRPPAKPRRSRSAQTA